MKRYLIALTIWTTWMTVYSQDNSDPFKGLFEDPVVAKGEGFEIKQSLVDERFYLYQANLAARGRKLDETQREAIQAQLIDKLVTHRLLARRATEADKNKARETADRMLKEAVEKAGSIASYKRQLIAVGMNEDQFKEHLVENALSETVIERELSPEKYVSEERIQSFYKDNPGMFTEDEKARISYIFFSSKDEEGKEMEGFALEEKTKLAKKVLNRLERGEDFLGLKKQFNEDHSLSGMQDVVLASKQQLYPSLASAAFSMKPGKISDIVKGATGFYILKLYEIIPQKLHPLEEIKDSVKAIVTSEELQKRLPDYLEKLKKEAEVVIY